MYQKYQITIPDVIDPYWVGFLIGDGCVYRHHGEPKGLHVALNEKDQSQLEALQGYFQTNAPIHKRGNEVCLRLTRKELATKLIQAGIEPNKTMSAKAPEALSLNRDFWRGLLDADGTITTVEDQPYMAIYGTHRICEQFIEYIKHIFSNAFTKRQPTRNRSIWKIAFTKRAAEKVLAHLYQDGDQALNRKMQLAQAIKG